MYYSGCAQANILREKMRAVIFFSCREKHLVTSLFRGDPPKSAHMSGLKTSPRQYLYSTANKLSYEIEMHAVPSCITHASWGRRNSPHSRYIHCWQIADEIVVRTYEKKSKFHSDIQQ